MTRGGQEQEAIEQMHWATFNRLVCDRRLQGGGEVTVKINGNGYCPFCDLDDKRDEIRWLVHRWSVSFFFWKSNWIDCPLFRALHSIHHFCFYLPWFDSQSSISSICCYHHKEVRKQSNLCGMYKRIFKESFRENVFFLFFLLLFIYPDVWSVVRN